MACDETTTELAKLRALLEAVASRAATLRGIAITATQCIAAEPEAQEALHVTANLAELIGALADRGSGIPVCGDIEAWVLGDASIEVEASHA